MLSDIFLDSRNYDVHICGEGHHSAYHTASACINFLGCPVTLLVYSLLTVASPYLFLRAATELGPSLSAFVKNFKPSIMYPSSNCWNLSQHTEKMWIISSNVLLALSLSYHFEPGVVFLDGVMTTRLHADLGSGWCSGSKRRLWILAVQIVIKPRIRRSVSP